MTEYEEITQGYDIAQCKKEFKFQLGLGYKRTDSFPDYLIDMIRKLEIKEGKTPTEPRKLTFEGIDDWNRPVFKDEFGNRFGDTEKLFNWGTSGKEVLETLNEDDIDYFGTSFGCEPQGTKMDATKIYLCS